MNIVILLVSIGVLFQTEDASESFQNSQIDKTPKQKPPTFLWDPDKRMWIESDDEDFDHKDSSGDFNGYEVGDFTFLDNPDNKTGAIEDDDEDINEELFNVNSASEEIDQTLKVSKPVLTESQSIPQKDEKTPAENLVKSEAKISNRIEGPLNLSLDQSTVERNHNESYVRDITEESHPRGVLEVNPATEYPLWPLEFESKRTKPIQKESVNLHAIEPTNTYKVIPLDDDELLDTHQNSPKNSSAINTRLFPKEPYLNVPIKSNQNGLKNSTLTNKIYNVGVDISEYRNPNEGSVFVPVITDGQTPVKHEYPVKTKTKPTSSTTSKPSTESLPELVLPEINTAYDTSGELKDTQNQTIKDKPVNTPQVNDSLLTTEEHSLQVIPSKNNTATELNAIQNKTNESVGVEIPNTVPPSPCFPATTTLGNVILHWPQTAANATVIPQELCLKKDGTAVTRTCVNGKWSAINGTCFDVDIPAKTLVLSALLNSTTNTSEISKSLMQITSDNSNITSYQIHLMSKLLERSATSLEAVHVDRVVGTINNIMHYEPETLQRSQYTLNSTDTILYSLDDYLLKTDSQNGYRSIVTKKLLVQEANFNKMDFKGFTLASSDEAQGFQASDVSTLNENTTNLNGDFENIDIGLVIPEDLKTAIKQCRGSQANPNIISSVFYDDTLFNSEETEGRSEGKIISVLLPGFNCSFDAPLQVIFKSPKNTKVEQKCAYWKYGSNERLENIKGTWVGESIPKQFLNTTYKLCEFSHITHFSLLLLGNFGVDISEADKKALDIITAVGCALSLLGLLAVLVTAIVFKSYRSANAVVIHFSIAMAAQIVLLFLADRSGEDKLLCTIFGAALHYVVLSQFCWMLTIALLQYKRYVLVFSNPTKHLMIKACAFSWGIPLIPIIAILSISTENYGRNAYGLCYCTGNYFVFGVLVPVAVIVFINLLVFLRIMIYIASRKIKAHRKMDNATTLQLRLAIMLYFLLGLTWGFGLFAAIGGGLAYSYLFCITATLQGFVLFLFFIALSDKTRSLWGSTLLCSCLDTKQRYDVNTDSSSHPMVRRPTSTNTSDAFSDGTGNEVFQKYKNRSSKDF